MKASRKETVEYIAAMLQELAALAKSHKLTFLAYLVEMAFIEVNDAARINPSERRATFDPNTLNGSDHT